MNLKSIPFLFVLLLPAAFALGQENLPRIHSEKRARIVSQKALFDATDLRRVRLQATLTVEILAETDWLTFGVDASKIVSARVDGEDVPTLFQGQLAGLRLPAPRKPGAKTVVELETSWTLPQRYTKDAFALADFPFSPPIDRTHDFLLEATFRVPAGCAVLTPGVLKKSAPGSCHTAA